MDLVVVPGVGAGGPLPALPSSAASNAQDASFAPLLDALLGQLDRPDQTAGQFDLRADPPAPAPAKSSPADTSGSPSQRAGGAKGPRGRDPIDLDFVDPAMLLNAQPLLVLPPVETPASAPAPTGDVTLSTSSPSDTPQASIAVADVTVPTAPASAPASNLPVVAAGGLTREPNLLPNPAASSFVTQSASADVDKQPAAPPAPAASVAPNVLDALPRNVVGGAPAFVGAAPAALPKVESPVPAADVKPAPLANQLSAPATVTPIGSFDGKQFSLEPAPVAPQSVTGPVVSQAQPVASADNVTLAQVIAATPQVSLDDVLRNAGTEPTHVANAASPAESTPAAAVAPAFVAAAAPSLTPVDRSAPTTSSSGAAFNRALARLGAPEGATTTLFGRRDAAPAQGPIVFATGGASNGQLEADAFSQVAGAQVVHAPIDDGALEQQLVSAIRMQWQAGVGEATIKLQPEHLGSMTVSLRVEGGAVSAEMRVETAAAQNWISSHEGSLRSALERQGLSLDRMVVTQDASPDRRQDRQERRPPRERPRRQTGVAQDFEVIV